MNQWNQPEPPGGPAKVQPSGTRGLTWLWVTLAAVGGLAVGCVGGVGMSGATTPSLTRNIAPAAPGVVSPTATETGVETPPTGPLTTFGNSSTLGSSTFEVGTGAGQVPPGRYFTEGGAYCYFELTREGTGRFGDIVTNENVGDGQGFVTIPPKGAGYISVKGHCSFEKK